MTSDSIAEYTGQSQPTVRKPKTEKEKQANRESAARWQRDNREIASARQKKWRADNSERMREIRRLSRKRHAEKSRARQREIRREWRKANPAAHRAEVNERRAKRLGATPSWADKRAIREFYKGCPGGFHVDHIIPLKGAIVCGLHVLNNLQYLTEFDNMSKKNRYDPVAWKFHPTLRRFVLA